MGSINVNRNVTDQFYRYKMPRLLAKVEGKGNGIKTVIANMVDVAKSLSRPPTYPTKFFGCELGAQTQFDSKNDRFIVNGSHDSSKLQDLLDIFIRKFVLCPECDNPETHLIVLPRKQMISQKCIACGYIGNIDMRHKLTTFILKNPPGQEGAATPSGKKGKKAKKDEKGNKTTQNGDNCDNSKQEKNDSDGDQHDVTNEQVDEDDWAVDTDADAVARRLEDLTDGAKGLMLNDDMEKTQQERIDIFYAYVKKRKAEGHIESLGKEVCAEAERLDIKDKAVLVLSELIFDANMLQQVKTYRPLLLRFTHENSKAQKYLLGGFEQLVQLYKEALMPKVAHILKSFYDNDIIDEEVIIQWSTKVSKKYVKKEVAQEIHDKVMPFIKWLKEAEEEESSEDEEDGEEVEVVYSDRNVTPLKSQKGVGAQPKTNAARPEDDDNDEDDVDIDAI